MNIEIPPALLVRADEVMCGAQLEDERQ